MIDVEKIRKEFPIYKKYPGLHFFDSAASSLKHKNVIRSLTNFYKYNGTNVHRSVYDLGNEATQKYEDSRALIAGFIKANKNEIVFTKSTTHSLNILKNALADTLTKGDEIIVSSVEHHSNLLPWYELAKRLELILKFIPLDNGMITVDGFKSVLTSKTKIVAINHISNVLGYITPVEEITKLAHKNKAIVILDAAQSIQTIPVDVKKLKVDFLAFSGHKMYGPFGIGVLYGKEKLLNALNPSEFGGEMVDRLNGLNNVTYKDAPYKFEAGTPPIAEAIALSNAVKFLRKLKLENIYNHKLGLRNYILEKLKDVKGVTIYNKDYPSTLISFNIDDVHPHDAASFFNEREIDLRAGEHCNQLTMDYLKVNATLRLSLGVYNNLEDCEAFIKTLIETRDFFNQF